MSVFWLTPLSIIGHSGKCPEAVTIIDGADRMMSRLLAFFLVNGYLLGREFFEFAAMRYRSPADARLFRAKHSGTVFLSGLLLAAFLAVPLLNLLTPLFAAGMMVHLHKKLSQRDPEFQRQLNSGKAVFGR